MNKYALINAATGQVENVVLWDGLSNWAPDTGYIAIASEEASVGWSYDGKEFIAPPAPEQVLLTPEQVLQGNENIRNNKLAIATLAIAPLQDAVDLDDATADEIALLKKWKQFRIMVNRVDLTVIDATWPDVPS